MITIRQYIPAPLKRALRIAYYFLIDAYRSISNTRKPMVPPAMTSLLVGSGDFHSVGNGIKEDLIKYADLREGDEVLEIGCGYGRIAVALTGYLSPASVYYGIDIVEKAVEWCSTEITPRYPQFRFLHADVSNPYANEAKGSSATSYRLPFEDSKFDVVFLTSVFSHMRPEEISNYIHEISRVLKVGGKCYATHYLLNEHSRQEIVKKSASQNFQYDFGNFLSTHKRIPEQTIAVSEELIRKFYHEAGLVVCEPIQYGAWANCKIGSGYQDAVISRKV